jgi:hypothetical protein
MKRIVFALAFALCVPAALVAQTVPVSATDLGGLTPITGTVYWQPVLQNGSPASYQLGGGGQGTTAPFSAKVNSGAFNITLPATDIANPKFICFRVTAYSGGASVLGPGYSCVQPHATSTGPSDWCQPSGCDFDKYVPDLAPQALVQVGPQGAQGTPGITPTFAVGTVTGLSAGSTPTVSVSGGPDYTLSFGIPTGATGAQGAQGATGTQGATGATGAQGTPGVTPTFAIGTVTNLSAGSTLTVSVSGGPNYTLSFGIPAGATGATGAAGPNTVSTSTTTAINGLLKGNGANVAAAVAGTDYVTPLNAVNPAVPAWLQNLGTGANGANTNASGELHGDYNYTAFTVPYGSTLTVNSSFGLTIHSTGPCIIAGKITGNSSNSSGYVGGASGGSGGGASAGTNGNNTYLVPGSSAIGIHGNGGAASGGSGANATGSGAQYGQVPATNGTFADGLFLSGAPGVPGANSGGPLGNGGTGLTVICPLISGTDGTHTGIIDMSGQAGGPAIANSTGPGSGGGGGVVILSSQQPVSIWPTVYTAGGPGGLCTVPEVVAVGGSCTSPPKATLGVTSGALDGTSTVVQSGAGCGTGAGITWNILGGGGVPGTAMINPTWSGGALVSATVTPGTSTGYMAATYSTCGTGGNGGPGWSAEFSGW